MKDNLKIISKDKGIRYSLIFCFGAVVLQITILFFSRNILPPIIPLFNSLVWGRDRLAERDFIFLIPIFLIFMSILSIIGMGSAYKKHALISRMLILNLLLSALLCTIAIIQIFLLVF